jgi:GDP-mannose transporter
MISATSFSLVGNLCKVITILANIMIWDKHAGIEGTAALLLCLAAGGFYQQAPLRSQKPAIA